MKLDSKYFDMIRIRRPQNEEPAKPKDGLPGCQWKGCRLPGLHRAPKGRGRDRDYYLFCADHIRLYNSSYNYFDGMTEAEVEHFQRGAVYGHRPTWKLGENSGTGTKPSKKAGENGAGASRQSDAQRFYAWRARQTRGEHVRSGRQLKPLERKALETLGVGSGADRAKIKARFKELVKLNHPDSNGGDRACEDRLRDIIQAYNYLKQAGLA
jgi:hypothetical protein